MNNLKKFVTGLVVTFLLLVPHITVSAVHPLVRVLKRLRENPEEGSKIMSEAFWQAIIATVVIVIVVLIISVVIDRLLTKKVRRRLTNKMYPQRRKIWMQEY